MKLSLAWIYDHFVQPPQDLKAVDIVAALNRSTAEVEIFQEVILDSSAVFAASVESIQADEVVISLSDKQPTIKLPIRKDAFPGTSFAVIKTADEVRWMSLNDVGSTKDGLFPPLNSKDAKDLASRLEEHDTILEIDNKSITHRPDLWCHRGFARELAAIFDLELKPIDQLVKPLNTRYEHQTTIRDYTVDIEVHGTTALRAISLLEVPSITWQPSSFFIAQRLAKVDARPIDMLVDLTNYVMFDLGQPMHAFDRATFKSNKFVVRQGLSTEKIKLLDGSTYQLTHADTVIANADEPCSLAGVMGGELSGVRSSTKGLIIEAANFEATSIRLTAARAKVRTESSARFEKSLDPALTSTALQRYLRLLEQEQVAFRINEPMISIGTLHEQSTIEVDVSFIQKRLGVEIPAEFMVAALRKLEFSVDLQGETLQVGIPSFRATKDISRPEDIVEEVGRLYGFDRITPTLPARAMSPFSTTGIAVRRLIEDASAFGVNCRQVVSYPFFDESFLAQLGWQPESAIRACNPMSANLTRLVTSLVPHLIKSVATNNGRVQQLGFFEINKDWTSENNSVIERTKLAYIFWHKLHLDFYAAKARLTALFDSLRIQPAYEKITDKQHAQAPWYDRFQSAQVKVNGITVGVLGMLDSAFYKNMTDGHLFAAEFDYEMLEQLYTVEARYQESSRYPYSWFDVSMYVPTELTTTRLKDIIASTDTRIFDVQLQDFFEKERRSITMRFFIRDLQKTLTTQEIDQVYAAVLAQLQAAGAHIR